MSPVSVFFSKDVALRRQARLNRTRKNGTKHSAAKIPSNSKGNPLDIIPEEDPDSPSSVPSMPSPTTPTTRARRRHALNAPPTGLKTVFEVSEEVVTFTDISFNFPLPPVSTPSPISTRSPCVSPLSSSVPSSPDSQGASLPLTPTSSDDEFRLPPPSCNSKRTVIKPLVINKLQRPATLPIIDRSEEYDSDDSDSEWYSREFSKILTLDTTASPTYFPAAHRDSFSIAPTWDSPLSSSGFANRRRRRGIQNSVFDVPPAPIQHPSPKCAKTLSNQPRRPLPRMTIPDDACSAFSLSLYTDDVVDCEQSPMSMYSQGSASPSAQTGLEGCKFDGDGFPRDFEVQVDWPLMLPLSLPGSPFDFEADITNGLEELWLNDLGHVINREEQGLGVGFILEDTDEEDGQDVKPVKAATPRIIRTSPSPPPVHVTPSPPPSPTTISLPPLPSSVSVTPPRPPRCSAMTSISSLTFPPSPLSFHGSLPTEERDQFDEQGHGLKSKWSSSTLGSVREEHEASTLKLSSASKFKMYFQGQHKRSGSGTSTPPSPKLSIPSPTKLRGKEKKDARKDKQAQRLGPKSEGDILIIGFDNEFPSRRPEDSFLPDLGPLPSPRRSFDIAPTSPREMYDFLDISPPQPSRQLGLFGGKTSPRSNAPSDCRNEVPFVNGGLTTAGGSGLRRKPIPVETFFRGSI